MNNAKRACRVTVWLRVSLLRRAPRSRDLAKRLSRSLRVSARGTAAEQAGGGAFFLQMFA